MSKFNLRKFSQFSQFAIVTYFCLSFYDLSFATASELPKYVPEDFKDLWSKHKEFVEFKFYGKSLGIYEVEVTPDDVSIVDPEKLLAALELSEKNKRFLLPFLEKPLDRNSNHACQSGFEDVSDCNYLYTKSVGIIYDESLAVINIFIAPSLLPNDNDKQFITPTSNVKKAFIQSQSLNYSNSNGYQNLYLRGMSSMGVSDYSYLIFDWDLNYINNNDDIYGKKIDANYNSAFYRIDIAKSLYFQTGVMDGLDLSRPNGGDFGFGLLPIPKIKGVRFGTTQAYINNISNVQATPITILLTQYSRIEAYRDNKLLGSFYYDSGVHKLDTSTFPAGSYSVELKYFVNDNITRTERISFNKSNSTAGSKNINYFIQGGVISDKYSYGTSEHDNEKGFQVGFRYPLANNFSLQHGLSTIKNKNYFESKIDFNTGFFNGVFSASISSLAGSDGARGNSQNIMYNNGFSISYYHYKQSQDDCKQNYDIQWTGCTENNNLSISYPINGWLTNIGYNNSKNQFSLLNYDKKYNDKFSLVNWRGKTESWQLNTSRAFLFKDVSLTTSIGLYQSKNNNFGNDNGVFINLSMSRSLINKSDSGTFMSAGYSYKNSKISEKSNNFFIDGSWRDSLTDSYKETEVRVSGSDEYNEAIVRRRNINRFGDVNGTLSANMQKNADSIRKSVSLSYDSSFAVSSNNFYWGGNATGIDRLAASAIIVNSNEKNEPLLQVSSGQNYNQKLSGGDKLLMPVDGTSKQILEVNEFALSNVNVQLGGTNDSTIFLLPGHLYEKTISANASWTFIGRAKDSKNSWLKNATILNLSTSKLDDDGGFSFDDSLNYSNLFLLKGNVIYSCPLTLKRRVGSVIYLGELTCESISFEKLPLSVKQKNEFLVKG